MPSPAPVQDAAFVPFTKAQHIQQLNDIDKSINQLLRSAGQALQILTSTQDRSISQDPTLETKSARKLDFERATNDYLTTLQSIDVGLRRQIWGLEEAGIITEKKVKEPQEPKLGQKAGWEKVEKESEGGTDKLDIGWLNSRSGKVGRDHEVELWGKARRFLEGVDRDLREDNGDDIMEG